MLNTKNGNGRLWWVIGPIIAVLVTVCGAGVKYANYSTGRIESNKAHIESLSACIVRIDATLVRIDGKLDAALIAAALKSKD